jgi:hypothetical protein
MLKGKKMEHGMGIAKWQGIGKSSSHKTTDDSYELLY